MPSIGNGVLVKFDVFASLPEELGCCLIAVSPLSESVNSKILDDSISQVFVKVLFGFICEGFAPFSPLGFLLLFVTLFFWQGAPLFVADLTEMDSLMVLPFCKGEFTEVGLEGK